MYACFIVKELCVQAGALPLLGPSVPGEAQHVTYTPMDSTVRNYLLGFLWGYLET